MSSKGFQNRRPLMLAYPTKIADINTANISDDKYSYTQNAYICEQNVSASKIEVYGGSAGFAVFGEGKIFTGKSLSYSSSYAICFPEYVQGEEAEDLIIFTNPLTPQTISIDEKSMYKTTYRDSGIVFREGYATFGSGILDNDDELYKVILGETKISGLAREIKIGYGVSSLNVNSLVDLKEIGLSEARDLLQIRLYNLLSLERLHIPNGVQQLTIDNCCSLCDLQLPSSLRDFSEPSYHYIQSPDYITSNITLDITDFQNPKCTSDKNIICGDVCVHLGNPETQQEDISNVSVIIADPWQIITIPTSQTQLEEGQTASDYWNILLYPSFAETLNFKNVEFIGAYSFYYTSSECIVDDSWTCYNNSPLRVVDFSENENEVEIENYAFASEILYKDGERYGLETVVLPKYKKNFGKCIFSYTRITHLDIPETWNDIEDFVFADMDMLTSVHIPPTIRVIGRSAFSNTKLTEVTIAKDCECGTNAFPDTCKINYYE